MLTTIVLLLLVALLIPAFTPRLFRTTASGRRLDRILAYFSAQIADINDATRRIRELQTAWPIDRTATPDDRADWSYSEL